MNSPEIIELKKRIAKLEALADLQTSINQTQITLTRRIIMAVLGSKIWPDEDAH